MNGFQMTPLKMINDIKAMLMENRRSDHINIMTFLYSFLN